MSKQKNKIKMPTVNMSTQIFALLVMNSFYLYKILSNQALSPTISLAIQILIFIVFLLFAVTLLSAILLRARGFTIMDNNLVIVRWGKSIQIPLGKIDEVFPLTPKSTKQFTRLFGNEGPGGYWGKFSHPDLGEFNLYSKKVLKDILFIRCKEGQYAIQADKELTNILLALYNAKEGESLSAIFLSPK